MEPNEKDEMAYDPDLLQQNEEYIKAAKAVGEARMINSKVIYVTTPQSKDRDRLMSVLTEMGYVVKDGLISDPKYWEHDFYQFPVPAPIIGLDPGTDPLGVTIMPFENLFEKISAWPDPTECIREPVRPKNKPWYQQFDRKKRF